jgi:alpha-galactosidase
MQRAAGIIALGAVVAPAALMAKPDTADTPPMGWRSWNAFELGISQPILTDVIDALATPRPIWDGRNASLVSLGYTRVGIDEGWEKCGAGVNGSWHDQSGRPIVDTHLFPDLTALVAHAHGSGAKLDW